jgi:hypothetical protein
VEGESERGNGEADRKSVIGIGGRGEEGGRSKGKWKRRKSIIESR